jgi:hypothetical protein
MVMPNLKRQWTVADRDELPDDGSRYEVIGGELFVTLAPAWTHQEAVARLEWFPEGAAQSLTIDLIAYFGQVLDS